MVRMLRFGDLERRQGSAALRQGGGIAGMPEYDCNPGRNSGAGMA